MSFVLYVIAAIKAGCVDTGEQRSLCMQMTVNGAIVGIVTAVMVTEVTMVAGLRRLKAAVERRSAENTNGRC